MPTQVRCSVSWSVFSQFTILKAVDLPLGFDTVGPKDVRRRADSNHSRCDIVCHFFTSQAAATALPAGSHALPNFWECVRPSNEGAVAPVHRVVEATR